ncbi:MAG TPA: lysylphosphatidylglycerol synthase domain-containing protein, partial [Caldilineaceae bacterium]|nr:lysylphosphatidylglycerol synthase domain-containing protein [Caldilineaceae bacterium]
GAAMLALAAAGLFAFPNPVARLVAVVVFTGFLAFVLVVQTRPLALWLLGLAEQMPLIRRFAGHFHTAYESAYLVFGLRNLLISLSVGMVCWAAEGMAYYLVLRGFGAVMGGQGVLVAIFIFCISTVIGAVFAMPGGLGGVEGSLVALSSQLAALPIATATAAALLIRFCTLWFGVLVGVVSFLLWPGLLAGATPARVEQAPASGEGRAAA